MQASNAYYTWGRQGCKVTTVHYNGGQVSG